MGETSKRSQTAYNLVQPPSHVPRPPPPPPNLLISMKLGFGGGRQGSILGRGSQPGCKCDMWGFISETISLGPKTLLALYKCIQVVLY